MQRHVLLPLIVPVALGAAVVMPVLAVGQGSRPASDPAQMCVGMMQGHGMTPDGQKAMRDFMQSPKAPQAMNNMMEMARRMGNGDVMLGMTKMMEMMSRMDGMGGGMMGGPKER